MTGLDLGTEPLHYKKLSCVVCPVWLPMPRACLNRNKCNITINELKNCKLTVTRVLRTKRSLLYIYFWRSNNVIACTVPFLKNNS